MLEEEQLLSSLREENSRLGTAVQHLLQQNQQLQLLAQQASAATGGGSGAPAHPPAHNAAHQADHAGAVPSACNAAADSAESSKASTPSEQRPVHANDMQSNGAITQQSPSCNNMSMAWLKVPSIRVTRALSNEESLIRTPVHAVTSAKSAGSGASSAKSTPAAATSPKSAARFSDPGSSHLCRSNASGGLKDLAHDVQLLPAVPAVVASDAGAGGACVFTNDCVLLTEASAEAAAVIAAEGVADMYHPGLLHSQWHSRDCSPSSAVPDMPAHVELSQGSNHTAADALRVAHVWQPAASSAMAADSHVSDVMHQHPDQQQVVLSPQLLPSDFHKQRPATAACSRDDIPSISRSDKQPASTPPLLTNLKLKVPSSNSRHQPLTSQTAAAPGSASPNLNALVVQPPAGLRLPPLPGGQPPLYGVTVLRSNTGNQTPNSPSTVGSHCSDSAFFRARDSLDGFLGRLSMDGHADGINSNGVSYAGEYMGISYDGSAWNAAADNSLWCQESSPVWDGDVECNSSDRDVSQLSSGLALPAGSVDFSVVKGVPISLQPVGVGSTTPRHRNPSVSGAGSSSGNGYIPAGGSSHAATARPSSRQGSLGMSRLRSMSGADEPSFSHGHGAVSAGCVGTGAEQAVYAARTGMPGKLSDMHPEGAQVVSFGVLQGGQHDAHHGSSGPPITLAEVISNGFNASITPSLSLLRPAQHHDHPANMPALSAARLNQLHIPNSPVHLITLNGDVGLSAAQQPPPRPPPLAVRAPPACEPIIITPSPASCRSSSCYAASPRVHTLEVTTPKGRTTVPASPRVVGFDCSTPMSLKSPSWRSDSVAGDANSDTSTPRRQPPSPGLLHHAFKGLNGGTSSGASTPHTAKHSRAGSMQLNGVFAGGAFGGGGGLPTTPNSRGSGLPPPLQMPGAHGGGFFSSSGYFAPGDANMSKSVSQDAPAAPAVTHHSGKMVSSPMQQPSNTGAPSAAIVAAAADVAAPGLERIVECCVQGGAGDLSLIAGTHLPGGAVDSQCQQ